MSSYADRLAALREQLKSDRLDGFVVPLTDEHMSEYVGSYAQRLAWLTGFQGSAGSAVVLPEEAAIFVDGRYTLQVRSQVDGKDWSYQSVPETSVAEWLKDHASEGARIGYDPWLHTRDWVKKAKESLASRGAELVPVKRNPIDSCLSTWTKLFKDDMPHSYDMGELGRYYRRYEALMAHWRDVLPEGVMMTVRYEDTVDKTEQVARELIEFIGLPWDDACLAFHKSSRPVKTASVAQIRKPIYTSSVERWRKYGKGMQPLLDALEYEG